jgi:polar amino acid transport system substrate-binding protein
MKRVSIILIGSMLVLSMLLAACSSAKPSSNTITVVTDPTFKPFEYTDDKGNMVGIDIDIMNAIAKKVGVTVDWKNVPFDSALAGLSECQYDVSIAAVTITADRQKNMLFSDPYLTAGLVVVVKKDNTTIKGMDDLKGKTVAAQLGTTGEEAAKKIENVTYKPYDTYQFAFQDLSNGQVDAVIADNPVAVGYVKATPDKLKTVGDVFDSEPYGIAFCKTQTALKDKINVALKELLTDGTIDAIVTKYNP